MKFYNKSFFLSALVAIATGRSSDNKPYMKELRPNINHAKYQMNGEVILKIWEGILKPLPPQPFPLSCTCLTKWLASFIACERKRLFSRWGSEEKRHLLSQASHFKGSLMTLVLEYMTLAIFCVSCFLKCANLLINSIVKNRSVWCYLFLRMS